MWVTRTAESVVFTLCPPGPEERYTSKRRIFGLEVKVHFLGFGHDGDRGGGGVDAALRFGGGHALHAVGPGLEFQAAVDLVAGNERDDFLVAAVVGLALAHDFDFPAHLFGVAAVHTEKIAAEEGRFFAARTGADFQNDVLFVQRVGGQEQHLEIMLKLGELLLDGLDFFVGHFADIGIGVVEQFLIVGEVLLQFAVLAENVHHGLEIRVGFGQLAVSILIVENGGIGEFLFEIQEFAFEAFEFGKHQ